ncbi:MAG: HAD-IC family P-type ATPase, partial [Clostridia bacterium]|nr:HAD-IC family P-type ATPase [Clostridia bacterium]
FVFDKTGTLTEGSFGVTEIYPASKAAEVLRLAAIAESGSIHPIAQSIVRRAGRADSEGYTIKEIAGRGVKAEKNGDVILAGNARFMAEEGVEIPKQKSTGSIVYVAKKGTFVGFVVVSDRIKAGAVDAIKTLKDGGAKTFMLTGDNESAAAAVAETIGVDGYAAQLLPQDKVARVEKIISEKKSGAVCFLGDGINDAPVLSIADVGVSMGGIGSDAAIEASDVVLMRDDLSSLLIARKVAKKTVRIAKENVVFALAVKAAVLVIAALGLAGGFSMWLAVFADVGVAVIAILNAMRALRIK